MELIIHSPSENGFLKEITFNHNEIKQELSLRLEKYKGLVYSEEEVKIAKTDRATLNKFKEAIETKRKEIKKQCLEPYEAFESKIKEILSLVEHPINEIDSQVKGFEDKQKEQKKQDIIGIFDESVGDLKGILSIVKIWNEKWLNSTYKLNTISEEIIKTIEKVKSDLETIEGLKSEYELQMKDRYLNTLLLAEALAVKKNLEEQKIKLDEYKKQQEAKEQAKVVHILPKEVLPQQQQQPSLETVLNYEQIITPELEKLEFRVWVTPEQKKILRDCILNNKIKCGKVGN